MSKGNAINADQVARELVHEVNAVLLATTLAKCERERMDAIDRELLARWPYMVAPEFVEKGRPNERITDPRNTWLMGEVDFAEFQADRQERIDALGHKLPRGHCPALCAESVQRDAEHLLVKSAERFFPGVTVNRILCNSRGLERLREYIDLLIKLVVNHPSYVPPKLAA